MQQTEKSVTSRVTKNEDIIISESSMRKSANFKVALHSQLKKERIQREIYVCEC